MDEYSSVNYEEENHCTETQKDIKIKCIPDDSHSIIEVHELKEKTSESIVLELPSNKTKLVNIIICSEQCDGTLSNELDPPKKNAQEGNSESDAEEMSFQCFYCGYNCNKHTHIRDHYNVLKLSKPFERCDIGYECKVSNMDSNCNKELREQLPDKCSNVKRLLQKKIPLVCPHCQAWFSTKRMLLNHIFLHNAGMPYKCSLCNFRCKFKQYLQSHIKFVHEVHKQLSCSKCSFRCKRKADLSKHKTKHSTEKPFHCSYCSFQSKSVYYLRTHMLTHKIVKPFHCSICDYQCVSKYFLKDHYINHHTHEKPFECQICSHCFKRNSTLKRHMLIHMDKKPYKCHFCEYISSRKDNLKSHIAFSHLDVKPFKCKDCNFSSKTKYSLKFHTKIHMSSRSFLCKKCNFAFNSESKLRRHSVSHSLKNKSSRLDALKDQNISMPKNQRFQCFYCSCNTGNKMLLHEQLENLDTESKANFNVWTCNKHTVLYTQLGIEIQSVCDQPDLADIKVLNINNENYNVMLSDKDGNNFSTSKNLMISDKIHCAEQMTSDKIYCDERTNELNTVLSDVLNMNEVEKKGRKLNNCPKCDEVFKTKIDLKDHVAIKHTDYRPFTCTVCGQGFKIKTNLKQHAAVHSEERPYRCSLCNYRAKLPETLKRHCVTHSNEKPFQCSFCNYRCKLKEKLKRHQIVHSAERTFHCHICEYACKTKELLKKHSKVHTRVRQENKKCRKVK